MCHYSTWGERGNRSLYDTKIIKAIYDAVATNLQPPPNRDEFFREVSEGVRFDKQRIRNENIGRAAIRVGIRKRNRRAADNNLYGDQHECEENENEQTDASEN
ncbi:uncharacterized protein LOC113005664 [Solenopsis invicta]|uniref:uncharacterized protein LOC113005664 n=1 Tax=Solenopsis invicta TaxID=13686 RepID=UPI000E33D80F|nr:uncharacterized protein LOC113005664 [Solenopsis invicta]